MLLKFPAKTVFGLEPTTEQVAYIAEMENHLDSLLAGLYAQLPADPKRYPIQIGPYVIQYRHRPRTVVVRSERRTG